MSGVSLPPIPLLPRSAPPASSSEPQRSERAVGGKSTRTPKVFRSQKPEQTSVTASYALALHKSRKDPKARVPITEDDLSRGVACVLERGLVPTGFGVDELIACGGSGSLMSQPAPLHRHTDQFRRADVMTTNLGFGAVLNAKMDIQEIEKIPPKASYAELLAAQRRVPTKPQVPAANIVAQAPAEIPGLSSAVDDAIAAKQREDTRTYTELLDLYSLHEFIIRKGRTLRNTPEFVSYKRSYAVQWGSIETVIRQLEGLLESFGIPMVYIDGKRVAQLAILDQSNLSKEELLSCIANRDEVEPLMASVVNQYLQGSRGHHVAATRIQSVWRMYYERKRYARLKIAAAAAVIIQRQWVIHRAHMKTRKLLALNRDALFVRWRDIMTQFIQDWPMIRESRRLVIHIPSLSLPAFQCKSIPFFDCFQAAQLMRLADLRDPNVDIVLLAPFKMEKEAFQYYMSVLKAAGVSNPEGRVCLLVPENTKRLPPGLSLTKATLMSTKTMKLLASLVRGKHAYVVPGIMGPEEHLLAARLCVPLLAAEPKVGQVLSTKSGGKTILEAAEVATPIGAYHIKSTRDLFLVLSRFMIEYRDVSRWLVKIDSEAGSRGHAFFDTSRLRSITEATAAEPLTSEKIFSELSEHATKRVKILHSNAYADWNAYADVFNAIGGCVEAVPSRTVASPTANLFIEPDGTVHLMSVIENIFSPQQSVLGCSFPQTASPYEAVRDAAVCIAQAAYRRKVMGYVSIDFVVYEKSEGPSAADRVLRLWAVDLDLQWTTNSCMHEWVMLLAKTSVDPETGRCWLPSATGSGDTQLHYVYSGLVYNPYIGAIRHAAFFGHCRQRGLSFDVQTRSGLAFHLVDTLLKGCFGAVAIGSSMSQCVGWIHEVQQLVQAELPKDADSIAESNFSYFVAAVKQLLIKASDKRSGMESRKRIPSQSVLR